MNLQFCGCFHCFFLLSTVPCACLCLSALYLQAYPALRSSDMAPLRACAARSCRACRSARHVSRVQCDIQKLVRAKRALYICTLCCRAFRGSGCRILCRTMAWCEPRCLLVPVCCTSMYVAIRLSYCCTFLFEMFYLYRESSKSKATKTTIMDIFQNSLLTLL